MMFVPYERAPLGELFIDVSIGFLVAIGCPMLVVVYCLSAFTFDRTKFAINMEVYPSGWFEQDASVNADPVQVAVIYKSLKSLRIMTALECLARVGVNVMFSFRLRYVVEIIRSPKRLRSSVYPKRHRLGAIGLVLYAIILVIFVEESMRTSTIACHPHPEYAVNAHRWTILKSNSLTQCPCLMLIDRDIAPKTFAEWIMPMNVTEKHVEFFAKAENALKVAAAGPSRNKVVATIVKLAAALTSEDSQQLKIAKLLIKFGDLTLETFLLYQMLESGSPTVLIAIFTSIVVSNALMCAAMMFVPYERAPLAESIIDVMFDFLIAIGCPMLTLCYCLSTFSFDRAKFAINLAVFPAGWFEQGARVVANPVQIAIISESLKSLRIMSALDFLSRIGVNATLCYRLRHVVGLLNSSERQHSSVYPKRSRIGAFGLALWAVLLVVFVEESMRTSALACATHPECVVNARRWTVIKSGSLTQCPCLTMIDRDIAPKTFADWTNPTNVTDKVIQLATTRDLQTLQITNRYLAELPEELRRCKI
ncbi:uncharacterized protein IUM83_19888 [Phytophthora cinnamomi]|uniref:uncharacterized protein n=1 Tax=Phytophthora cinnamomi TaxID=4785 RepID=UPI00355988C3|nr:hypothetical protein IUM83_19888 [Phytophthora cinnamomi]